MRVEDTHHLRGDLRQDPSVVTEGTGGFGYQVEGALTYTFWRGLGVEAGYRDNGAPGLRDYAPDYFAAYLLDPDGHNAEAVHRSPETRSGWDWLGLGLVRDDR